LGSGVRVGAVLGLRLVRYRRSGSRCPASGRRSSARHRGQERPRRFRGSVHDMLHEQFTEDETILQLETAVSWGRYAQLFDFDASRRCFVRQRSGLHGRRVPLDRDSGQPKLHPRTGDTGFVSKPLHEARLHLSQPRRRLIPLKHRYDRASCNVSKPNCVRFNGSWARRVTVRSKAVFVEISESPVRSAWIWSRPRPQLS
jgi:hypothetical protein